MPFNYSDYSKYDTMTTEELYTLVQQEMLSNDSNSLDSEALLYIEKIIEQRNNFAFLPEDVDMAWEKFEKIYLPMIEDSNKKFTWRSSIQNKKQLLKILSSIAAIFLLIIGISAMTVRANGHNLWGTVVNWTNSFFQISIKTNTPKNSDDLLESLKKYDVAENKDPWWLPDGYHYDHIEITDTDSVSMILFCYTGSGKSILFDCSAYSNKSKFSFEKNNGTIETYTVNSTVYYIYYNMDIINIVWSVHDCIYSLSGYFTMNEAVAIINQWEGM